MHSNVAARNEDASALFFRLYQMRFRDRVTCELAGRPAVKFTPSPTASVLNGIRPWS